MSQSKQEVSFYQISFTPLEKALPKLVQKIYESKQHCFILCKNEEQMMSLDDALWSSGRHFLPHNIAPCDRATEHPILLGTDIQNLNSSKLIINLADFLDKNQEYEKIIDMFNGFDKEETILARKRYKSYKDAGTNLKFWKQDESGNWTAN